MGLTPEERIKRLNAYHRNWVRRNPEKVKCYRNRYILRKAAELKAQQESAGEVDRHETSPA